MRQQKATLNPAGAGGRGRAAVSQAMPSSAGVMTRFRLPRGRLAVPDSAEADDQFLPIGYTRGRAFLRQPDHAVPAAAPILVPTRASSQSLVFWALFTRSRCRHLLESSDSRPGR